MTTDYHCEPCADLGEVKTAVFRLTPESGGQIGYCCEEHLEDVDFYKCEVQKLAEWLGMSELKPDDGGPAFPNGGGYMGLGMTLRDWFAGQANVNSLKKKSIMDSKAKSQMWKSRKWADLRGMAIAAYCLRGIADAMLKAREGKNETQK